MSVVPDLPSPISAMGPVRSDEGILEPLAADLKIHGLIDVGDKHDYLDYAG